MSEIFRRIPFSPAVHEQFINAKKRNFRKNGHFQMAVALWILDQIKFSDRHFWSLVKSFKILIAKWFFIQKPNFGVIFKRAIFRKKWGLFKSFLKIGMLSWCSKNFFVKTVKQYLKNAGRWIKKYQYAYLEISVFENS